MTKKKRLRKEQRQRPHGNPPPAQITPFLDPYDRPVGLPPDNLLVFDETNDTDIWDEIEPVGGDLNMDPLALLASGFDELGPDTQIRPMERGLMRIQRYLERKGITVTPENEKEIEELLDLAEWRDEPEPPPATPLERAQALVYDAFELPDTHAQQKIQLAKQALKISHSCADAHTLLAELEAPTDEVALRHYEDAIKAAERALKDVDLTARPRDFWYLMKIRPLLRALSGAAYVHNVMGHDEKALGLYRRLYEIDHLDVLEVRDGFVGLLTGYGHDEEYISFLEKQGRLERLPEETPHIQYSYALTRFRLEGNSERAQEALQIAQARNPVIARYLLGAERVALEPLVMPGADPDERKAAEYFMYDCHLWLRTPNAIEWLREHALGEVLETTSRRKQ